MTPFRTFSAALAFMSLVSLPAFAQTAPAPADKITVNICGGGTSGNYIKVAKYIKVLLEMFGGNKTFDVKALETGGSKDNLKALVDGRCQVGILQNDTANYFANHNELSPIELRMVSNSYSEQAHLLCHRDLGYKSFSDLSGRQTTVFVGSPNSGGAMMLDNLVQFYKKSYEGIISQENENVMVKNAAGQMEQKYDTTQNAILLAAQGKACAFFVQKAPYAAISGNDPKKKLDARVLSQMNLVSIDDWKFNDLKDGDGNRIYEFVEYAKLIPKAVDPKDVHGDDLYADLRTTGTYWSSKAQWTLNVAADLVVNEFWEKDMMDRLSATASGTSSQWTYVLDKVKQFKGDFRTVDAQISNTKTEALPQ